MVIFHCYVSSPEGNNSEQQCQQRYPHLGISPTVFLTTVTLISSVSWYHLALVRTQPYQQWPKPFAHRQRNYCKTSPWLNRRSAYHTIDSNALLLGAAWESWKTQNKNNSKPNQSCKPIHMYSSFPSVQKISKNKPCPQQSAHQVESAMFANFRSELWPPLVEIGPIAYAWPAGIAVKVGPWSLETWQLKASEHPL